MLKNLQWGCAPNTGHLANDLWWILRKAASKDLLTNIFEQLFRVLVGLNEPRIRASGGLLGGLLGALLGLPAALGRSWAGLGRRG